MNDSTGNAPNVEPLRVMLTAEDAAKLRDGASWQRRVGRFWTTYMPRGKGWVPRLIGRRFSKGVRDSVRTASGAFLVIDFPSLDVYCWIERRGGLWDANVLETCFRYLKPGSVFYDIGSNVGLMAIEMAKRFQDKNVVVAFEPQPDLARAIAESVTLNEFTNLKVFNCMLGEKAGEAELFIPSHSIHASAVTREAGARSIRCPVLVLDELIEGGVIPPPDVIKIDVEGAEWNVFSGAARMITRHRPVIVFECDENALRFGYTRRQLCDYLRSLGGYQILMLRGEQMTPLDDQVMDDLSTGDLVALPQTAASGT